MAVLGLVPHPEGGYFREVHRSASLVHRPDSGTPRPALTAIYFLLAAGDMSRWHCVASDETWHFHEGEALELLTADPGFAHVARQRLGPVGDDTRPVQVVPAGDWQAARSTGAYTLVSCTVAPGFEFADFALLRDRPADAERLRRGHPDLAPFV